MKSVARLFAALTFMAPVLTGSPGLAEAPDSGDKTLSPYFFVKSDNPDTDRLPLKSTSVDVNIAGVIADAKVTQVYRNEGKNALEAIYVFPASTRAAVYAMKMTIGDRTIVANIKKRDEARQEYEQAKQQGKSASLLEQQRPNVFQMNVANIMPGDEIRVEMNYTELLVPTDKEYEFMYPTVVGPRYSNQQAATAPASEHWVQNPYLHQGETSSSTFDIKVHIAAGMAIQKIASTSHKVDVHYAGNAAATIALDTTETSAGNKDYILKYRLAGGRIESGLLLSQGDKENFFLLMLQPPKRVKLEQIPGRDYVFIVDVSGSMYGYPLEISKKLLKDLISSLRPTDTFNVLLFSGGNSVLSEQSLPATQENIARAVNLIDRQQGSGGTELLPALKRALALPKSENISRSIVIATDGYVSVETEAFDLIRSNLGNANMFAFGIGTAVNRHLIEGMARVGMGEPFVITKPEEAPKQADAFRTLIQSPVLTRVKVEFGGFEAYDVEPATIPDVLADRPVIVFGKWRGKAQGNITVKGFSGEGAYQDTIDVSGIKPSQANSGLRYLWARHRIAQLSDYNLLQQDDKRVKEVTELGLAYNLLTNYTSFVAIDSEVRNKSGNTTTIKQPLPLPEGVSDYAVGGYMAAAPTSMPMMRAFQNYASAEAGKPEEAKSADRADVKKQKDAAWEIRKIAASGGLSRKSVRNVIERNLPALGICLPAGTSPAKLTLKLVIQADGTVKSVEIASRGMQDKAAEQCLLKTIKAWKFDASASGKETEAEVMIQMRR
ncbi:MAG TPA: VIT domain-containing protein [Nitrospirota bacterium]|nr:VIT domain-containing protein [Nitrospirota bacterium]